MAGRAGLLHRENALLHADLADAAVIGIPDPVAGEAELPRAASPSELAEPVAAGKSGGETWSSLAGSLGDTQTEALAAAEVRLEVLGDRLAELPAAVLAVGAALRAPEATA